MGYSGVVVSALALFALATAMPSIGDNTLDGGEQVVFVSPVLAPPRESRSQDMTRSGQFPILILLAQVNPDYVRSEPEAKSLKGIFQPIYVQKLEDQERPAQLNRQKRHLKKKNFSGHGGGGGYSRPSGGCQPSYGGGGGSFASSQSSSYSGSYGKR